MSPCAGRDARAKSRVVAQVPGFREVVRGMKSALVRTVLTLLVLLLLIELVSHDMLSDSPVTVSDSPVTGPRPDIGPPDIDPNDLKKNAYTAITANGKAFVYIVFPRYTQIGNSTRPPPKFYDLDGYRVFPLIIDKLMFGLTLRLAQAENEKTIVADGFIQGWRRRVPPPALSHGHRCRTLIYAGCGSPFVPPLDRFARS